MPRRETNRPEGRDEAAWVQAPPAHTPQSGKLPRLSRKVFHPRGRSSPRKGRRPTKG